VRREEGKGRGMDGEESNGGRGREEEGIVKKAKEEGKGRGGEGKRKEREEEGKRKGR
jgi:hypothetical protein